MYYIKMLLFKKEQRHKEVIMNQIIHHLEMFGFSKMEGSVYLTLLQSPELNGSQISKILSASRSAVYGALNSLYEKGAVFLLPGDTHIYKAQNPEILIDCLKTKYLENAKSLKEELVSLKTHNTQEVYWNIKGYEPFIAKTRELLHTAEKEIYMNTNCDLSLFTEELTQLAKKNVRILHFSFEPSTIKDLPLEYYYNSGMGAFSPSIYKRMMLVVDCKSVLLVSGELGGAFMGIFTENPLLVSIISEHIHHDIYFLKLEKKYGKSLVDKDILLGSLLEKKFQDKIEFYKNYKNEDDT